MAKRNRREEQLQHMEADLRKSRKAKRSKEDKKLAKKEKESRKNQKVINIKEVQLSPSIDTNDFNTKCNHAIRFLKSGDKVKVTVRFRGREVTHSEIGETLLKRFAEQAKEYGSVDRAPKLEGRNMTMFLMPNA